MVVPGQLSLFYALGSFIMSLACNGMLLFKCFELNADAIAYLFSVHHPGD